MDDGLLAAERVDAMTNRAQLKRTLGIGLYSGANDLNIACHVTRYVHVGGTRYPVRTDGDLYCVSLFGWSITSRTLEKVRDGVIEALEGTGEGARFDG